MNTKKNKDLGLPRDKVLHLMAIYDQPGFQVVLDVFESICNDSENEFLGVHPTDDKAVLATHAILHAQRALFQAAIHKIDYIIQEERGFNNDNRRFQDPLELLADTN